MVFCLQLITVDVISGSLRCISCVNTEVRTHKRNLTEIELLSTCDKLTCYEINHVYFAHGNEQGRSVEQTFVNATTNDSRFIAPQNRLPALRTQVLQLLTKASVQLHVTVA